MSLCQDSEGKVSTLQSFYGELLQAPTIIPPNVDQLISIGEENFLSSTKAAASRLLWEMPDQKHKT